ncbi:MAG: M23 family metallopeptidase [Candidatus Limnocylindrales bacterium]
MRVRRTLASVALALVMASVGLAVSAPIAAADADEPVYYLPAPMETELLLAQGNGDAAGRSDGQEHAFHFVAAEGPQRFPVLAARGGTVIGTRVGVRGGRCDEPLDGPRPSCWREVNYVLIDHGDGTSALYQHLKRGASLVRSGDVVSVGQRIGTAGSSGWTAQTGLGFQLQRTPAWHEVGRGGWFLTGSLPVAFADPDVVEQRPDGVPLTDDTVISANPGPAFKPFRFAARPAGLPANVPLAPGIPIELSSAYEADSSDGYGLHLATPVGAIGDSIEPGAISGIAVRPLFGGELVFAGCATGASASLGRSVVVRLEVEGTPYLAVHGHLSRIEPELLERDPTLPFVVGPNDTIGHVGDQQPPGDDQSLVCPGADPARTDLFVAILRDGAVSPQGEISGGIPVSPEPLVGERGYEGFAWWSGPLVGLEAAEEPGRPRARWNARTPASGSHIRLGDTVRLVARVRDVSDIAQVRFRAWYPRWPQVDASRELTSFDPATSWRELAVCAAPLEGPRGFGSLCAWDGDTRDARVSYVWDPQVAGNQPSAPWLPPATRAITRDSTACVPVSLAVEVIDRAGHVYSQVGRLPLPAECDDDGAESVAGARVLYLDPLVPPRAPTPRGRVEDRGWPPVYAPDPLKGAIVWRDRSDNEDGFRVYARRSWLEADCSITDGPWQLVTTLPSDRERYRPNHRRVAESIEVPRIENVPGNLFRWEYAVSAFNEAGETRRLPVGGFVGGSEAFCDPGLVPPPELEP